MNSIKALERIKWRFSQGKPFQPNKNDVEALNSLIDYCAEKHKQALIDHEPFAKLYIYLFGEFIKHYETTLMDMIPQNELNRILAKPTRQIVQEFVDAINMGENYQDPTGKTATWEYSEVADNLRIQVTKALEEYT